MPLVFPVGLWHQHEKFLYSSRDFISDTSKESSPVASQILAVLSMHRLNPGSAGRFDLTPLSWDFTEWFGQKGPKRLSCFPGDLPQAGTASPRLGRDPAEYQIDKQLRTMYHVFSSQALAWAVPGGCVSLTLWEMLP